MSSICTGVTREIDYCYPVGKEKHEWKLVQHNSSDTYSLYHNGEFCFAFASDFMPDLVALLTKSPEEDARVEYVEQPPL
jgi:hypothetical protein